MFLANTDCRVYGGYWWMEQFNKSTIRHYPVVNGGSGCHNYTL